MKALSIIQPWAWLIAKGVKDIENREWRCPSAMIGKTFVIHASSKRSCDEYEAAEMIARKLGVLLPSRDALDYGAAIGTARIVSAVTSHQSPWFFGKHGFVLADQKLWETPVPWKDALGFWHYLLPQEATK